MASSAAILIVDDEPRMCESLETLLRGGGYEIQTRSSGREAIECLAHKAFDLVLLDLLLPDMYGYKVMDEMNLQNSDTSVIIMTGYASTESAITALRRGANDYIKKPFEYEELLKTIENALAHQRTKKDYQKAVMALRESEERYRAIVEDIPALVCRFLPDGTLTFVNSDYCTYFNKEPEELIGKNFFQIIPENVRTEVKNKINSLSKESPITTYEHQVMAPDGALHWQEWTSRALSDEHNHVIEYQSLGRDITEQKRAEYEKEKLESRLLQSQKLEAIGTLAGGIAHDFNNLLMGILGHASLMLMDVDDAHAHFENLKGIEEGVGKGADLTKQLLGFARGGKYQVRKTDLNRLLEKTSQMFGRTKKEIVIHPKYQKDIWPVEADQGQIEQVLLNLYVNAWQAMPEGGHLYLKSENVLLDNEYVKPYSVESGQYVKISVRDTGFGMDKKTQERIFDPFFTTKEIGRGTGLGLASAYGIIKNHHGFIEVSSEEGQGSTFDIYLPSFEIEVIEEKKES